MIPISVVLYYNIYNFYIELAHNNYKDNNHYVLYDHKRIVHYIHLFLRYNTHTHIELNIHHYHYTMTFFSLVNCNMLYYN